MLNNILQWILNNKLNTCLGILTFSFTIATIAVAVEKSNLQDYLKQCKSKLDSLTPTMVNPTSTDIRENNSLVSSEIYQADYRLPSGIIPKKYHLHLYPNISGDTFQGNAKITFEVVAESEKVILHSNNLEIESLTIKSGGEGSTNIESEFEVTTNDTEFLTVSPKTKLGVGTYEMEIKYSGSLSGIVGFYKSTYGDNRNIATSKFEPTYARQAFPCFDEPAMKAVFSVELVTPKDENYIALSNMDVISIKNETDHKVYQFRESVPMSTYLACFIVCDFISKSETINTGKKEFLFSVYAAKEQIDKVDFSLKVGLAVTKYYIDYFGIDYPLPKLDMIAIPDFVSGAMEHWGLVTYRETNLLHSNKTTSPANAQNIARVVAHEISHMWFGNLVTMKWWNDLWLNEGFASYMQYKALDEYDPSWKMMEQFLTANTHSILALDATLNSHPIVQTVETPDEITAIFDSVTYNKGAAVIRMLEGFVGEDNFKTGVTAYLKRHEFGNTVTQDLLDELEVIYKPVKQNITYIMDTWTKQMGFPIISISFDNVKNEYSLKQKRFLADPENKPETPSKFNDKWTVPITCRQESPTPNVNESTIFWFYDDVETFTIPLEDLGGKKILKLNNDQVGYYRVSYDTAMWDAIKASLADLNKTMLTSSDRANILNDVFTLAQASEEKYDLALDISQYLSKEKEYAPWSVGSSQFSSLKSIMSNSIAYIELKLFVRNLLEDIFSDMKNVTEESPQVERLLQATIFSLACSMGHKDCLNNAQKMFEKFIAPTSEPVDPNLRNIVYYYGIQQTGEEEWLQLWDMFMKETDAQEKTKLMQALAASKEPTILLRYLDLAWDQKNIRSQDHLSVVQYIASNPIGTSLAWDHVRENWPRFVETFTLNSRTLGTMIPGITKTFASELRLKEMEDFFTKYPNAGAGATARKQAIENVKNNIKWLKTHEENVREWLLAHKP